VSFSAIAENPGCGWLIFKSLDLLLLFHQGKRRACLPQAERLSALAPAIAVTSTWIIFTFQFLRLEGLILIGKKTKQASGLWKSSGKKFT